MLRIATRNVNTLWIAAFTGMSAVVAKLLEQGFKDIEDSQGRSILIAALEGNYIGVLELILQSDKTRKEVRDCDRGTPPLAAMQENSSAAVRMLLGRRDIDLISRRDFGYTPLTLVLNMGSRELMQAFLDSGRLPNTCDPEVSKGHKFAAFLRAYTKSGFIIDFLAGDRIYTVSYERERGYTKTLLQHEIN